MSDFPLRHAQSSPLRHAARGLLLGACAMLPAPLLAQRAAESAADNADDAFGETVGSETIGIYTDTNVRGFNPQQAGNGRIDGVYFDQTTLHTFRVKQGATIRVGDAALNFWSPAPTGIVANRFRSPGDDLVISTGLHMTQYFGTIEEIDAQIPVIPEHLSLTTGVAHGSNRFVDGSGLNNFSFALMPRYRQDGFEIKPFVSGYFTRIADARPLFTTTGPFLPAVPRVGKYLGQTWANNKLDHFNHGVIMRGMLTDTLGFRGGAFRSSVRKRTNFTEIFSALDTQGLTRHRLIADPDHLNYSNSWEALFYQRLNGGNVRHTFLAGVRGRLRHTESGGSDAFDFGTSEWGEEAPQPRPVFDFAPVNVGRLKQTTYSLGYFGRMKNVGQLTLGLHKSVYDATFKSASGTTTSSASPWLYNVGLRLRPFAWMTVYGAYVTGLEDSGAAPENAENRNQQLPASRTRQIDGGLNVKFGKLTLVSSLFQITKPYFSYDTTRNFVELGTVRHRGAEVSLAGDVTDRLHVLAGAVIMAPVVSGPARDLGLIGKRPVGVPKIHSRIDLSYRTAIWDGLTFTATGFHDSKRAASAGNYAELGDRQLFLPSLTTVDLGIRHHFKVDNTPLGVRLTLANVFDAKAWKSIASNVFQQDERRRLSLFVLADF